MSRRLNRDSMPLHKLEACSNYCNGHIVHGGYFHSLGFEGFVECPSIGMQDELVVDLRGHTYCCGSERGSFHQ